MKSSLTRQAGWRWLVVMAALSWLVVTDQLMATRAFTATDRRYEFKGVIRSVNKPQKTAVIRHEKVGDYMEPMTMPFWIRDEKALAQLEARDQIVATLVVTKKDGEWLENIFIVVKGR